MAQPSKLVTDRVKSSRAILAAGSENLSAIIAAGKEKYGAAFADASQIMVETMVSGLTRATSEMEAADLAHAAELGDDDSVRLRRDKASEAGRQVLIETHDAVATVYGATYVSSLGFEGETPEDPQRVLHLLRTVGPALQSRTPPPAKARGVKVDLDVLREDIMAATEPLASALNELAKEARQNEATQVAKDGAIARYDVAFSETAGTISTLLQLAGLHALAKRVRPSTGRPGRTMTKPDEVTVEVSADTHDADVAVDAKEPA